MNAKQKSREYEYYSEAFKNNSKRRELKLGSWPYEPSNSVDKIICSSNIDLINKKVLDVGCGDGRHVAYFLKKKSLVTGIDFCDDALRICNLKFKGIDFKKIDMTKKNATKNIGKFDLILDWSVLDHIRMKDLIIYTKNLMSCLSENGFLIISEFTEDLPGKFKNKNYKIVRGAYSRGYRVSELQELFPNLKCISIIKNSMEDEIKKIKFHTLLFQNR